MAKILYMGQKWGKKLQMLKILCTFSIPGYNTTKRGKDESFHVVIFTHLTTFYFIAFIYISSACFYPQDAAERMIEDVQLCFEELINTINHAQNRAISFIEAEKVGAHQKIEKQKEQLGGLRLSISMIKNKIDECINNDSYFNFLLVSL